MLSFSIVIPIFNEAENIKDLTKEIFSNPQHIYTKALISSIPVISDLEEKLKPKVTEEERNMVLQNTRNI